MVYLFLKKYFAEGLILDHRHTHAYTLIPISVSNDSEYLETSKNGKNIKLDFLRKIKLSFGNLRKISVLSIKYDYILIPNKSI